MAIIYSYPETLELLPADMLIGTSTIRVAGKKKNITKNFTLELLKNFILDGNTGVQWGTITGTLSNQTDLQAALNAKQNNITLTTTGSSGPATLVGATLNVPDYSTGITVPTLDQVLTAGNTSILAAKIGVLYGYDNVNSDYGTLEFYDSGIVIKAATTNHFLFYNDDSGTVQFSNGAYKPTLNFAGVGNNIYTFQNSNGTLAFTSDIPSLAGYVPDTRTISTITPLQGGGDLSANRTLSILQSSSLQDGYLSSADWTMFNNKQSAITLTTTGSSGSSTLVSGTLNIPTYTLSGLGGQPLATNLTSLSGLTYASTSFVKMTAAGTFALDTNDYITSPLTTKGDIFTYNSTNARLPVGLDTQILLADSSTSTGLKWGTNTAATPLGYYGAFQDITNQTAAAINTGYPMRLGITDLTNGVTVVSNSRITIANTGIYNIQWSAQFTNPTSAEHDVTIWLRKNGVDVPGSSGIVLVPAKHGSADGHVLPSWNFLLDVVAGDYYEFVWSTVNTSVYISFQAAGNPPPSTASVVMTVTQQSGIMAGTGITAINSLTGASQTLATNGGGTDFNIVSSGTTHTFNLPTASATNRGALSSADWSTFNGKFNLPSLTSGSVLFSNGTTIAQDNAQLFWDDTNNRLGIGTASPTEKLTIDAGAAGTSLANFLVNGGSGARVGFLSGYGAIVGATSANATYISGSRINFVSVDLLTEFMRITSAGNVGIGTAAPTAKLAIKAPGALSTDIALRVRNSADSGDLMTVNGAGTAIIKGASTDFYVNSNSALNSTGRFVILNHTGSSSPLGYVIQRLGVELVKLTSDDGTGNLILQNSWSNYGMEFNTAGANTRMFISGVLGNIGIGTTAPVASAKVQIDSTTQGFLPPRMTTTQKNAIATPATGLVVFDTTLNKLCVRGASAWETITSI